MSTMFEGQDWKLVGNRKSTAIIGDTEYLINAASMFDRMLSVLSLRIIDFGVQIHFPAGELEVLADPHALLYTDFTTRNLIRKVEQIADELLAAVPSSFERQANLWEAKKHFAKVFYDLGALGYALLHVYRKNVVWNGIPVEFNLFQYISENTVIQAFGTSRKMGTFVLAPAGSMEAADNTYVIIHDLYPNRTLSNRANSRTARRIIKQFYEQHIGNFRAGYLITFRDAAEQERFYNETHFHSVPVLRLSEIRKQHGTMSDS